MLRSGSHSVPVHPKHVGLSHCSMEASQVVSHQTRDNNFFMKLALSMGESEQEVDLSRLGRPDAQCKNTIPPGCHWHRAIKKKTLSTEVSCFLDSVYVLCLSGQCPACDNKGGRIGGIC